jgi:hypothetical protein
MIARRAWTGSNLERRWGTPPTEAAPFVSNERGNVADWHFSDTPRQPDDFRF